MTTPAAEVHLSWLISLLLLLGAVTAEAAFEFTSQGARAWSLGGAFSAVVDEAEGIWFNPAANGRVRNLQGGTTHALLYPGLNGTLSLNGLAAVVPMGRGGAQVGISALNWSDWQELTGVIGYGLSLHPRLATGVSLRSSGWKAERLSHRSWSMDVGATYEAGWVSSQVYIRLGVVLRNLNGTNISAGGYEAGKTPRGAVLAGAFEMSGQKMLIDIERSGGRTEVRMGYESLASDLAGARIRLGASLSSANWAVGELDAGIGHSWKQWYFDYAYAYPLQLTGLGGIHSFSLGYRRR